MTKVKKNIKKKISGVVTIHVYSSVNNTIITATDASGNALEWASGGRAGFKGTRKSTPFAAQSAIDMLSKKIKAMGATNVEIAMKGIGAGREAILKGLQDFQVSLIRECTSIPHNGPRRPKKRKK